MARIHNNLFLHGVSGMIGSQMVVRNTEIGQVMAIAPAPPRGEPTEKQKGTREMFGLAIGYAKGAQEMPEYKNLAAQRPGVSAFNVATADFFHAPEVQELDLSGYNGKVGDVIEARAIDDVAVKKVGIMILTADNVVIETGLMTQSANQKSQWTYVATKDAGVNHVKVIIDAADLASQVTQASADKNF